MIFVVARNRGESYSDMNSKLNVQDPEVQAVLAQSELFKNVTPSNIEYFFLEKDHFKILEIIFKVKKDANFVLE